MHVGHLQEALNAYTKAEEYLRATPVREKEIASAFVVYFGSEAAGIDNKTIELRKVIGSTSVFRLNRMVSSGVHWRSDLQARTAWVAIDWSQVYAGEPEACADTLRCP